MIIEFTAVCCCENLELFQKKFISIPRLELTAALLSVKMACLLKNELDITCVNEVFWTDTKVVLGYITNTVKRFKTFVANRVQQIKEKTDVQQWCYVPTKQNPADDASRGLNAARENSSSRWFQGPRFLWQEDNEELSEDDPEIKKDIKVCAIFKNKGIIDHLSEKVPSWSKMKRIIAIALCYKKRLLQKKKGIDIHDRQTGLVSLEDIQSAEREIIKSVQEGYFKDEIEALKKKQRLKASSCIIRLDLFMDSEGLLRVGGRICKSVLEKNIQHPILMPRYCRTTQLIIEWCHNQVAHAGRGMTTNAVRASGYW